MSKPFPDRQALAQLSVQARQTANVAALQADIGGVNHNLMAGHEYTAAINLVVAVEAIMNPDRRPYGDDGGAARAPSRDKARRGGEG